MKGKMREIQNDNKKKNQIGFEIVEISAIKNSHSKK
jgi:hypothetical protein